MSSKKCVKSKFIPDEIKELMNESQFLKDSSLTKKNSKRTKLENSEDEVPQSTPIGNKKRKIEADIEASTQSRQKILDVMDQQLIARKKSNESLFKCLSNLISQLDSDHAVMKENEQKFEQLTGALIKSVQQTTSAHKQILKALKEIHDSFMKQVEGLLTRGAMKPDDRPLWFDVYKAFPPITEPKFARPKPEIQEIRPILYKEDVVRAKFHSNGHGLAPISLLSQSNESQTKRLVEQYDKLKTEGVPESEIIEKAAQAVTVEHRANDVQKVNITPKNPNSITSQVLAEADIQNIFKEK